jgi:hypothetical protein
MASKQSLANKAHHEMMAGVFAKGPVAPETLLELGETEWSALTAEPRGVDYIEDDAAGTPVMWVIPKDSIKDRAIIVSAVALVSGDSEASTEATAFSAMGR